MNIFLPVTHSFMNGTKIECKSKKYYFWGPRETCLQTFKHAKNRQTYRQKADI